MRVWALLVISPARLILLYLTLIKFCDKLLLWEARRPDQLSPAAEVTGWSIDDSSKAEIDRILRKLVTDSVGPEFMAPPTQDWHDEIIFKLQE